MWEQRIYGMEYVYAQPEHPEYLLVCDDDVEFEPDFARKLIEIAREYQADNLIPIRDRRVSWPRNLISTIVGGRSQNSTSPYKITIKRNGRFSVNNSLKSNVNPTQSGPFQCFLMRTDITPLMKLREELWLDETRYAWPDDQVFFYKAHLLGLRNFSCKQPSFTHLDGKAGTTPHERKLDATYGNARNIVIFHRRFMRPNNNGMLTRLSFSWYMGIDRIIKLIFGIIHGDLSLYRNHCRGVKDGKKYPI